MSEPKRISPQEAQDSLGKGYVYVDVRTEQEFAEGHPAGAINVPLSHMGAGGMTPNPDFLAVMEKAFPKDAKIVVGCKAGGRSLKAARSLIGAGYTDILDQRAGWDGARDSFGQLSEPGWSKVGLPTDRGEPEGRSYASFRKKVGA